MRDAIADRGCCVFSGDTCQIPGLVIFSFMSNILGLLPLVVLLQSSFWTGSVEMGMGIGDRWNIIWGVDRNGSQLGGLNVRVLGLFSNSFLHSFRHLSSITTSSRLHSLTGGKEAITPTHTPHIACCGKLLNTYPLYSAQIPSLNLML